MKAMVNNTQSALEDLLESCHGAIYAYGVIAAYMKNPNDALDAMAAFRIHRDRLLTSFAELQMLAPPAKAAYEMKVSVLDELSARAASAMLEENAVAHWANALFYVPETIQQRESEFLQSCALRSFNWSGVAKAFSSAD
jgi:hypothetical protein